MEKNQSLSVQIILRKLKNNFVTKKIRPLVTFNIGNF